MYPVPLRFSNSSNKNHQDIIYDHALSRKSCNIIQNILNCLQWIRFELSSSNKRSINPHGCQSRFPSVPSKLLRRYQILLIVRRRVVHIQGPHKFLMTDRYGTQLKVMRKNRKSRIFQASNRFDAKHLPEFLLSSQAVIAAATEVLYTQSTQLFPGPDDTVTHQVKLAIDQDAEIVYWLVPQPATGYISLVYLG